MGETQKSIDGIIEKFAMITDAIDTIFPEGKMSIIFELKENDFKRVQDNFKDVDKRHSQFKIDISGTEFIFLKDGSLIDETSTL
jgi:hypothetical protein